MWHQIPRVRCLRALDAVARSGSMSRAAAEDNISQSAISQSIRELEDFVQARLLDRSTRPVELTVQGEAFHRVIVEVLGRLANEVEDMRAAAGKTGNAITVSCNLGFATHWLMPRLSEFSRVSPGVKVSVTTAYEGSPSLGPEIDLAIRFGDGKWSDGTADLLFEEMLVPTCSPEYLEHNGPIATATDLRDHPLIQVRSSDPGWLGWADYLALFDLHGDGRASGPRFSNYVQAVQATIAGEGIMLGWRSVVGDLLEAGHLVAAFGPPMPVQSGFHIVRPLRASEKAAVAEFVDWISEAAEKERSKSAL